MKLLWLDLETTGLDPRKEQVLEVAVMEADFLDPFNARHLYTAVLPLDPGRVLIPFITEMHTKNGLLEDCERSITELAQVERDLLDLVPMVADKEERTTLAGSSIHFDHEFLKVYMPKFAARLSHRHYDISSWKLLARSMGRPHTKPDPAHRAMDDVLASIKDGRDTLDWFVHHCYERVRLAHGEEHPLLRDHTP